MFPDVSVITYQKYTFVYISNILQYFTVHKNLIFWKSFVVKLVGFQHGWLCQWLIIAFFLFTALIGAVISVKALVIFCLVCALHSVPVENRNSLNILPSKLCFICVANASWYLLLILNICYVAIAKCKPYLAFQSSDFG